MTGRILLRLSPIAAVLALAACGGSSANDSAPAKTQSTSTSTTPSPVTALRVYFLKDGKVQPVARDVPHTTAVAGASFQALAAGPTRDEQQFGLTSEVPGDATFDLALADGVLRVKTGSLSRSALAQVVYTATQFPTVKAVEIGGTRYTRADFEDETPIILVESPLPFQHVSTPLRAQGTANTFEATFNYDLVDSDGNVIKTHFETATSGSGERGTYDFTVPFSVDHPGLGKLVVYELSAEDGSRIHQNEVPIYLGK